MKTSYNLDQELIWKKNLSTNWIISASGRKYRWIRANMLLWSRLRNKRFHNLQFIKNESKTHREFLCVDRPIRIILFTDGDKSPNTSLATTNAKHPNNSDVKSIHISTREVLFELENFLEKLEKLI